jgi:ABC-type Fe3+-hydroxamate transport system substrate-binding protein
MLSFIYKENKMKKLLVLLVVLTVSVSLFAGGGGQSSASASGAAGPRVVTQVASRPLTITPQYGERDSYPQPATSYSTTPRWPQQPAVSNRNGFPIVQNKTTLKLAIPYYSYVTDYNNNDIIKYISGLIPHK